MLRWVPHNWEVFDASKICDLLITTLTNDLSAMDKETLLKLDPNAQIDEDGGMISLL